MNDDTIDPRGLRREEGEKQLLVGPSGPVGAPGQVGAGGPAEQLPEVR